MKTAKVLKGTIAVSFVAVLLQGCGAVGGAQAYVPRFAARSAIAAHGASSGDYTILYNFSPGRDGSWPQTGVTALNGRLFGTTSWGGHIDGVVYKLTTSGQQTVLYRFNESRGAQDPQGELLVVNNTLYGTAQSGGAKGRGAIFAITPSGREQHVVYSFQRSPDLSDPKAGLVERNGTMYGTARGGGGQKHYGGVYSLTTSGVEHVLHRFDGAPNDGAIPYGKLTLVNGVFYGTTLGGGSHDSGSIYSITPSGKERLLYSFKGGANDGAAPIALTLLDGTLYGTTVNGGDSSCGNGCGTVFAFKIGGTEGVLHKFKLNEGARPSAALLAYNGQLYGTTCSGGLFGNAFTCGNGSGYEEFGSGSLFRISPGGSFTILHYFSGYGDGATPVAPLIAYKGALYGTTQNGGNGQYGTVFRIAP